MLFEEELAILDFNTSIHMAEEKGEAKGINSINRLNEWLIESGRESDVQKAIKDPNYQKALLIEYEKASK